MLLKLISCLFFLSAFADIPAQESPLGVFLTTEFTNKKNCQNLLYTKNKKVKVCATLKPILSIDGFTRVTDIKNVSDDFAFFNLVLTQQGYDRLKGVIEGLAETELVLVVDRTVIGFIKNKDNLANKSIQLDGPANSNELVELQRRLKEILATQSGH